MSAGNRLHPWVYFWTSTTVILAAPCYWMAPRSQRAKAWWLISHNCTRLCKSRPVAFPPFHAYEGTGIRSLVPFFGFCHLPSTLLGNRIWSPFAQGDVGLCPLPRLGKPFPLTSPFLTGTFLLYLQNVAGWLFAFPNNHGFILLPLFIMTISLKWEFKTLRLPGWNWREREKYRKPQNKTNI